MSGRATGQRLTGVTGAVDRLAPTHWSAAMVAAGISSPYATLPLITPADAAPIIAGLDLWDSWPLETRDGRIAMMDGEELWFMLSAPQMPDPGQRHGIARIRLLGYRDGVWRDYGHAMPDGYAPGMREWAGSAVLEADGRSVSLYFTATGRPGNPASFEQRLFAAKGALIRQGDDWAVGDYVAPQEIVAADGDRYVRTDAVESLPGMMKAFRDPAFFHDPVRGQDHMLFTASAGWDDNAYNGVVGLATRDAAGAWQLNDPLIEAIGVNNELERVHVRHIDGRYYVFWSTQRFTFAKDGPVGPNGLYGMVADALCGPYRPVNGSGLIVGNPAAEPTQCYSWWVTADLQLFSFIDHWGMAGRTFDSHPQTLREQFGGVPSPRQRLRVDGDRVMLI